MTVEFCLDGCRVWFEQERINYNRMRLSWQAVARATTEAFMRDYAALDKCRSDLLLGIYQLGWHRLQDALQQLKQVGCAPAQEVSPSRVAGRWLERYFNWDDCVLQTGRTAGIVRAGQTGSRLPGACEANYRSADLLAADSEEQLTPAGLAERVRRFSSMPVQARLEQAFFSNAFSVHLALLDLLQRSGRAEYRAVETEEAATAQAMHAAIQAGQINKYRLAAACCEILTLNPYNRDYYLDYLTLVGDQRNELERMAEFCGVPGIRAEKEALIRRRAVAALRFADSADLTRELKQLVAACVLTGINPTNRWVAMLEERIAECVDSGMGLPPPEVLQA